MSRIEWAFEVSNDKTVIVTARIYKLKIRLYAVLCYENNQWR